MNGNEPKPGCSKSVKKSSKWNRNQQKCEVHTESAKKSTDDGDISPGHDRRFPFVTRRNHKSGMKYPSGPRICHAKSKYIQQDILIKEDQKVEQQPTLNKDSHHVSNNDGDISQGHDLSYPFVTIRDHKSGMKYSSEPRITHEKKGDEKVEQQQKLDKVSHHVSTDDGDISPGHVPRFPFVTRRDHKSDMKYPSGPRITHAKSKYIQQDKLIEEDEEKAEQQQELLSIVKRAFQDETCDVVYFTSQAELRGEVIKEDEEKEEQQEESEDNESSRCDGTIVEYLPNNEIIIESPNYLLPNIVPLYFEPQGCYTSLNKSRNFSKVSKETLCFISGIPFIPGHIYFEIDRQENENQKNESQENGSDENDSDEELDEVKWPMIDKTPSYLTGTN